MKNQTFWREDRFDSEIFGLKVAKISSINNSQKGIRQLTKELKKKKVKYATYRFSADRADLIRDLQSLGFYLVDSIISFEIELSSTLINNEPRLREPSSSDIKKFIKNLGGLYTNTRITNDLFISKKADEYYSRWVLNSIHKKAADNVLVFKEKEVEGFISLKRIDKKTFNIPLLGVFRKYQGRGVGKRLVMGALFFAKELGANAVTIDTQTNNISAIRTYLSCGFKPVSSSFTFAWHE